MKSEQDALISVLVPYVVVLASECRIEGSKDLDDEDGF